MRGIKMVAAIGSSALTSSANGSASPITGLEAQIARYQKQLSDCVNCDSAKTLQGKQNIQQISDKISVAKARIDEISATRLATQASDMNKFSDTAASTASAATGVPYAADATQSDPLTLSSGTVGGRINVLA
jgi:hypothetical protein